MKCRARGLGDPNTVQGVTASHGACREGVCSPCKAGVGSRDVEGSQQKGEEGWWAHCRLGGGSRTPATPQLAGTVLRSGAMQHGAMQDVIEDGAGQCKVTRRQTT